ncbi:MAG: PAS domain S-box protein [Gammaproteobacteria bacterium]|nr:PAS domain S-box protein [Gammaproteobacteria bacterium]
MKDGFKERIAEALERPVEEGREKLRNVLGAVPDAKSAETDQAADDTIELPEAAAGIASDVTATQRARAPRVPDEQHSSETELDAAEVSETLGSEMRGNEGAIGASGVRAILESVKDAIVTTDLDGRILSANFSAQRIFGASEAEMRESVIGSLVPGIDPPGPMLSTMSKRLGDTLLDLSPKRLEARRGSGQLFPAELTVSMVLNGDSTCYVLSLRDITDRIRNEAALRDSEARYRALVENAPEAIVVLDVDEDRFVDANENAAKLFKLSREELLAIGPASVSVEQQNDDLPSFGPARGYIESALEGGRPVFEWMHRDAGGREIPCEVRFIRLPDSDRRLIRASIIDINERRQAELLARGERRVLELVASSRPLDETVLAVVEVVEEIYPEACAALMLATPDGGSLELAASARLPERMRDYLSSIEIGVGLGVCGSTAAMARQIVVRDVERDSLCGPLLEPAKASGIRACFSSPISISEDRVEGTLAMYFKSEHSPAPAELGLVKRMCQLAGIAIRHVRDADELRVSELRFRELFDNVVDGVFQIAPDGEWLSANPALVAMLGYDDFEALKRGGSALAHHSDEAARDSLIAEMKTNGRVRNFEYPMRRKDGKLILVLENSRAVSDLSGEVLYYEGTLTDITQRKLAESALYKEKERAQVTLQSIGDAVITTDARGNVDYLNPAAEELSGWERRRAQGQPIEKILCLVDDQTGDPVTNPVRRALREGRVVGLSDNVALQTDSGDHIAIQDSAAPIQDTRGEVLGAVMVFHDVRHARQLHHKLSYQASHDSLTGLINRREFEERLADALEAISGEETPAHVLLYMDLDQFKVVNDTCGHTAGDLLLRQLGDLLQTKVRGSDVLARLGGDEFAVLLVDCTLKEAVGVGEQLREAISEFRFAWRDSNLQVGVSIGIVELGEENQDVNELLSQADVACYVAKDLGRNRIHVYQEGDAAERHREMQWVARINQARDDDRFELFFQPIVPIAETVDAVPKYELLLRMRTEAGDYVPPNAFIPAAERYNLMPSIDRWVIEQVFDKLVCNGQDGSLQYTLAVNLSGTTLNDAKFLEYMLEQLSNARLPDSALCFEVTETAAIANLSHVVHCMNTLRAQGCKFALDDFGSGLSSLTYLKNLPVDYLKIDGSFIRNVNRDSADHTVVEAIARMASALEIQTIAERVESEDVMKRLGQLGICYAQGYYVAGPRPVSELPELQGARGGKEDGSA